MERAILDTDILSELLKGLNQAVLANASEYRRQFGCFTISTLTVLEVVKGFAKAKREERIAAFLKFLEAHDVLTLDTESATLAGRIYNALESQGTPIGRVDPMIAAIAIRHDLVLVTGNTEHYARVGSAGFKLQIQNWRDA